jgi:predicted RNA-binding Zn-ribbon protein involved in translation (DUF1610 family)
MSNRPGDGCTDPRVGHEHWCGGCGESLLFHPEKCQRLSGVPPCPRCGSVDWRDEIDGLILPGPSYDL